jgi:hypothetical protein
VCVRATKRRSYIHERVLTPSAVSNELGGGGVVAPRAFIERTGAGGGGDLGGGLAPSAFATNRPGRGDFTPSAFANELGVAKNMSPNGAPPSEKRAAALSDGGN